MASTIFTEQRGQGAGPGMIWWMAGWGARRSGEGTVGPGGDWRGPMEGGGVSGKVRGLQGHGGCATLYKPMRPISATHVLMDLREMGDYNCVWDRPVSMSGLRSGSGSGSGYWLPSYPSMILALRSCGSAIFSLHKARSSASTALGSDARIPTSFLGEGWVTVGVRLGAGSRLGLGLVLASGLRLRHWEKVTARKSLRARDYHGGEG